MPRLLLLIPMLLGAAPEPVQPQWEVHCEVDALDDSRTCMLLDMGGTKFAIYYAKQFGPIISPGDHDFPNRQATVRVDKNPPISFTPPGQPGADEADLKKMAMLVDQMQQGHVVIFEAQHFPDGARRASFTLDNFPAAYKELQSARKQTGAIVWKQRDRAEGAKRLAAPIDEWPAPSFSSDAGRPKDEPVAPKKPLKAGN